MMHSKLNPSRLERLTKRLRYWWQDNGLAVALCASVAWLWAVWFMLGVGW